MGSPNQARQKAAKSCLKNPGEAVCLSLTHLSTQTGVPQLISLQQLCSAIVGNNALVAPITEVNSRENVAFLQ